MIESAIETREHINSVSAPCPIETKTQCCELHVFDTSLYRNLFDQAVHAGLSREQARSVVAFAATCDSLGVVTENISGEKDDFDNYVFDIENRIRMQLTPFKHLYLEEENEMTHEPMMVAPEHKWGSFKKDVLSLISSWRRGMDKVGMAGVRARFLDKSEDALKEGETIIWGSPKAEQWEGESVMRYNGRYGFLYVGRVININGIRVLEVHDFKNDLDASAYDSFFQSIEGEVCTNPLYLDHPLVDKVKASYVRTNDRWTIEAIWRKLGEIQSQLRGQAEIFDLPADVINSLQDPELHKRIHSEVAAPIGIWIADEIYKGTSNEEIQRQVRQKFIDMTLKTLQMRSVRERVLVDVSAMPGADSQRYTDRVDPVVLQRYSGSSGIGCGSWGSSGLGKGGISFGISSVVGLSGVFGFGGEAGKKNKTCSRCGEVNYCTKTCYKCDGMLI